MLERISDGCNVIRQVWVAIAGLLVLGVFGVASLAFVSWSSDGPLEAMDRISIEQPLPSGETGTWGMVLPMNPTQSPITIESIDAVNPQGIEVIGIVVNDPDVDGGVGTALGFPPAGTTVRPAAGAVLQPAGSASPNLQVLVGVRHDGIDRGTIEALRIAYTLDGNRYEEVLPYSLVVP